MEIFLPIEWLPDGKVRFLDQTRLPQEEIWIETADYEDIAQAIRRLQLRGAPLIGIAAAYGLALAARAAAGSDWPQQIRTAADVLLATRPTAVNLSWAVRRLLLVLDGATDRDDAWQRLGAEARRIHEQDIEANRRIGRYGADLLVSGASVLTHCNAGSLATGGYGTALGVVRAAREQGKLCHVYATETRPLLQGARLTAWELRREGIPFTLITDTAAGSLMRRGLVGAVVVGADRIAANGDTANKIGTYQLAVLARESGLPFYVAAPTSTIDLAAPSGDAIPIEERSPDEVVRLRGVDIAPPGTQAANPAFDVTPHRFIAAIVTENGVAKPPFDEVLPRLCGVEVPARG